MILFGGRHGSSCVKWRPMRYEHSAGDVWRCSPLSRRSRESGIGRSQRLKNQLQSNDQGRQRNSLRRTHIWTLKSRRAPRNSRLDELRFGTVIPRVTSSLPSWRHREVLSLRLPSRSGGTTPGVPVLPAAPNTYRGSARTPFASVSQLSVLANQRPRNSSVPPDGQAKRRDRLDAVGSVSSVGGIETASPRARHNVHRLVPVR
jgi:hypothetical protein